MVLDEERCTFAGECVYNHPEVFEWTDTDTPIVRRAEIADDAELVEARHAIASCPSGALSISLPTS